MTKITLTVLVALALVLVPSASANPSARHEIRVLRHKLLNMTKDRNTQKGRLRSRSHQIASLKSEVAELRGQIASLQTDLAHRTNELDVAQKQATALQGKLDAIPTSLLAAEQYLDRVVWAAEATDPNRPKGEIVSLEAMNYVADNHVNLFMRAYLLNHGGLPSLATANDILTAQAGLCGNAEIAFEALVRHFGFDVRRVNFYYDDPASVPDGHTAAEVYYDGAWHFFDPTFSIYWRGAGGGVLDINTVRASGGTEHKNNDLLFNVIENERDPLGDGDDSWFETAPGTLVTD